MLTLQFVPNKDLVNLEQDAKIKKLLNLVKEERILLLEGRLSPEEESNLIKATMEQINKKFKGIEIATIYNESKDIEFLEKLRNGLAQFLLGYEYGMTIIGPASIVKEIKKDPNKIEVFTKDIKRRR